jgi:hypothetical protein
MRQMAKRGGALTQRVARLAKSGGAAMTQRVVRLAKSTARVGRHIVEFAQTSEVPRSFAVGYAAFILCGMLLIGSIFMLTRVRLEGFSIGYQIMQLEKERDRLRVQLRELETELTQCGSPVYLLQMNQALGLYLLPPEQWLNTK